MKSYKIITILFLLTLSLSNFGQTYKVQSITKGIDFNEYSSSNRNYLERVIDIIKNSNITVKEGDLAIVSMKDGGMNFIFRFYRSANMLAMSHEDYLKVTEFNGTSNFINGISYIEMSVVRKSNVITSGEIRFYPDKYSKQAFTVKFLSQNKTSSSNNKNLNNTLSVKEDNTKQRLVFVDIDHDPNFDYESLNQLEKEFSESEIRFYETENNAYVEITKNDGNTKKWEFFRVFEGAEKTDIFTTSLLDSTIIPRKMVLKRYLGKVTSLQIGYYKKENLLKGGASLIIHLSASKDQVPNPKAQEYLLMADKAFNSGQEEKAKKLYMEAAAMNNAEAHFAIAYKFIVSEEERIFHFSEAAKMGHAEALEYVLDALFFRSNSLTDTKPELALEIYNLAKSHNPSLTIYDEEHKISTIKKSIEADPFDVDEFIKKYKISKGEISVPYGIWELAAEASRGGRFVNPNPKLVLQLVSRGGSVPAELMSAIDSVYFNWKKNKVFEFNVCDYVTSRDGISYCSTKEGSK